MRYYWVTSQSEYSTAVLFRTAADLEELFPRLLQYSTLYFEAREVMTFLGRKLNGNFQGDLVTDQLDFLSSTNARYLNALAHVDAQRPRFESEHTSAQRKRNRFSLHAQLSLRRRHQSRKRDTSDDLSPDPPRCVHQVRSLRSYPRSPAELRHRRRL